ncbi:MAG TPA: hypothetical protein DEB24_03850 [Coriobacteriia bacterium]|nr:hypothetical protein [Coriobacteriia bacterium]
MGQEYEPQNGFEKSAKFYLEAAKFALATDRDRLAMHLYRAAFEVENAQDKTPSPEVIDGLRRAWDIACDNSDRSSAESIFGELSPFNSTQQNEQAVLRLQSLALNQLEDMGITESDIENIATAFTGELDEDETPELVDSLKDILENIGVAVEQGDVELAVRTAEAEKAGDGKSAPTLSEGLIKINNKLQEMRKHKGEGNSDNPPINYRTLVGFDNALKRMREFGFMAAGDDGFKTFVERSAAMHGVAPLSLESSFLFYGPSPEDVNLFAQATASEIGIAVIDVVVDLDPDGNGTIKLAGPFKRNFFGGPPDYMSMPTPCIILIENIDHLQCMFNNEAQAIKQQGGYQQNTMGGRSMQAEIIGYLKALRQRPGVFIMATSQHTGTLKNPLLELLGPLHELEIADPQEAERLDVLAGFAEEHPSFMDMDLGRLANLSSGLSRRQLVEVSFAAVESSYRESLRTGRYNKVEIADVLFNMAQYLNHDTPLYKQVEDEAVAQLYKDIEEEML